MNIRLLSIITFLSFLTFHTTLRGQTDDQELEVQIISPENIAGSYDWRGTTDFGGNVEEDICGEVAWAGEAESLGCDLLGDEVDLSGRIALVRRGDCFFSQKIYHAQETGASAVIVLNHPNDPDIGLDGTIGMSGGDSAAVVTVPAVFLSYNSSVRITEALDNGEVVEMCIILPRINQAFGPYSYFTPQSQIVPMENMQVTVYNRGLEDQDTVETILEITDPSGNTEVLSSFHVVAARSSMDVSFDPYIPSEIGEYNMKFISGIDGSAVERKFEITELMWGMDNGNITGAIGPSSELFQMSGFEYQHGNLVLAGADGVATHLTFGIGNGADLYTGEEFSDLVLMAIYDGDKNEDDVIDDFTDFASLGDPLEVGFYQLTGEETFDKLISVPFDNPVSLKAGGIYYVSLQYSGIDAGTGVGPQFSATSDVAYLNFPSTPLQLDQLYSGWAGAILVTRLQLEGFASSVKDLQPLASEKLTIYSNPICNDRLSFALDLDAPAKSIQIRFRNIEGKLMKEFRYSDVRSVREDSDVSGLPSGTYFLNVDTDEGFISRKVVLVK